MDNLLAATLLILVFPKAQSLVLPDFLSLFNDLPDNILSKLAIYADDTTVHSCLGKTNDVLTR